MKGINFDKERVLIIDPTSAETNRGSFCYLSYLIYSYALSLENSYVILEEEFRVADLERIEHYLPEMDHILVALWSYPQIETCLMLNRIMKGRCKFFGYYPLIKKLGLSPAYYTEEIILQGMRNYPNAYTHFEYLLLSDCDMHIKLDNGSRPKVYPLFTSYGCPKGCAFCPSTVNQSKRLVLDEDAVYQMLERCQELGIHNIHFTDEDFFFDAKRAFDILMFAFSQDNYFKFITLGSVDSVYRFMTYLLGKEQWEKEAIYSVLHLVEIGLETADIGHIKELGKQYNKAKAEIIAIDFPVKVLWLIMTFGPGETINSIIETGRFLKDFGLNPVDLEERIVTNGTEGGLGQFFQIYEGTGIEEVGGRGKKLTHRPLRLIPSYIPYSFINCAFKIDMEMLSRRVRDLRYWMSVYGLFGSLTDYLPIKEETQYVRDCIVNDNNVAISIAIMARLGIIKEV